MINKRLIKFLDKQGLIGATLSKDDNGNYVLKSGKETYIYRDWIDIEQAMKGLAERDILPKEKRIKFVCEDCPKTESCEFVGQSEQCEVKKNG